jgi:hypothetical protein
MEYKNKTRSKSMRLTIAALLVLASHSVAIPDPVSHELTARELLSACTASQDSTHYAVCVLFIYGFNSGADATLAEKPWCRPQNLTVKEEILALIRVWHTYPQLLEEPISTAVGAAMVTAYPCHPETEKKQSN